MKQASAGLGAAARELRGRDPAPHAPRQSRQLLRWAFFRRCQCWFQPGPPLCRILRAVIGSGFPGSAPRALSTAPGSARRRRLEEFEKPNAANQVSELLPPDTITRDEPFLPDTPLLLTAHLSPGS
ncbi:Unconventional Myosin-Viia [Manis pentadactyla]|nr:Unconventional Myosin-Viia [Manis pentadactyla]